MFSFTHNHWPFPSLLTVFQNIFFSVVDWARSHSVAISVIACSYLSVDTGQQQDVCPHREQMKLHATLGISRNGFGPDPDQGPFYSFLWLLTHLLQNLAHCVENSTHKPNKTQHLQIHISLLCQKKKNIYSFFFFLPSQVSTTTKNHKQK